MPNKGTPEQICARRMEKLLNKPSKHRKTRAYVATLPKRGKVAVASGEFLSIPVADAACLAVKILQDAPVIRKDRIRPRIAMADLKPIRDRLRTAQKDTCGSCGLGFDVYEIRTVDHVIPRCRGGGNEIENLLLMHFECNNKKGDRMPNAYESEQNRRKNEALG